MLLKYCCEKLQTDQSRETGSEHHAKFWDEVVEEVKTYKK